MNDDDVRADIMRISDEKRTTTGTTYEMAREWAKQASYVCIEHGWWKEYVHLKEAWAI